jgi:hypothetical protein
MAIAGVNFVTSTFAWPKTQNVYAFISQNIYDYDGFNWARG